VEKHDLEELNNPMNPSSQKEVYILFALYNDKVVGTLRPD